MDKEFTYTWCRGKTGDTWEGAYAVRVAVFVDEQGFSPDSENEALDDECHHILAGQNGKPAATARVFEGETAGEWHIGRVAVLAEHRGCGLGRALMQNSIEKCRALGAKTIVLGAQADKTAFYEGLGFAPTGETYDDEGCPHVMMAQKL